MMIWGADGRWQRVDDTSTFESKDGGLVVRQEYIYREGCPVYQIEVDPVAVEYWFEQVSLCGPPPPDQINVALNAGRTFGSIVNVGDVVYR